MKLLKIKDNSQLNKEEFSDISHLAGRIVNKTLEKLEQEGIFVFPEMVKQTEDLTKDQMILQGSNEFYLSSNVMGFLGYGDERLIIGSRFNDGENDYFFQYLLEKVLDFPNIVDLKTDADQHNRLFNYFLFLFPQYLKTAMRKGLYKQYICHYYNNSNIKGVINIKRHITNNTPFIGNIAYSQREFSYDNYLTQLIRHTIEFIKKKPYGQNVLRQAKDEIKTVIAATPSYESFDRQKIIIVNKKNTIRHAYYREYYALQILCLLILQHQKHQIGSGSNQLYGILFDGAWLWEEYINSLVSDIFYHPMNKSGKDGQRLFSGNIGLIYPDFISHNCENRMIADAKYKPIGNINNKDYLQVLAYMYRFDARFGYYFYPEAGESDNKVLYLNKGSTYESNVQARSDICLIKHGLKIPNQAENYETFSTLMAEREMEFRKKLGDQIGMI